MESAGDRWWPIGGGVYFLQAVKRVRGVRLIMPKWSDRLAPVKALAASPQKVEKDEDVRGPFARAVIIRRTRIHAYVTRFDDLSGATSSHAALLKKLDDRTAHIGILGLGYVGLPLMLRFSEVGYKVIGFDIDQAKVDKLNNGQELHRAHHAAGSSAARSTGASPRPAISPAARDADALIICVPTPLNKYREPDLSFVIDTTEAVVPHMRKGQVLSLESTTYPGTTEEELRPLIEAGRARDRRRCVPGVLAGT